MIKILLVDNHKMILDSLTLLLQIEDDIEIAASISDSRKVMDFLETNKIDIIITNLSMPYLDGLQLTRQIKSTYPKQSILMLSSDAQPSDIRAAYSCGISGFILKKASRIELLEAIRTVHQKKLYFSQESALAMLNSNEEQKTPDVELKFSTLTNRELEIVSLLVEEMSSAQIAMTLKISPGTVDSHRHNILKKLNVKTTIGVIKYAIRIGLH